MIQSPWTVSGVLACLLLLGGCGGDSNDKARFQPTLDERVAAVAQQQGISGDPSVGRSLPDIASPKAQLGMQLFFSKGLGGDLDSACVSCHHPMLGGGDDLSLSIGVEAVQPDLLGPGRLHLSTGTHFDGGPTVPRNAPSTFNIVFYDEVLFHDGRVESLDKTAGLNGAGGGIRTPDSAFGVADPDAGANLSIAQARFPVTSPEEMRGFSFEAGNNNAALRTHLEQRLRGSDVELALVTNQWLDAFRQGFEQPAADANTLITYDNVAEALASYQNSQVLIDSPWKAYREGDLQAISDQAKRGALLFYNSKEQGGAGCAGCHSGDFLTDEQFHVVGMPQVGRGKGDGPDGSEDFGRFRETGDADDKYAFRTPHLLNVTETGPWGHAGGYTSLEAVVRHHLNPQQAIDNFDFSQLDPAVQVSNMTANTQKALDQLASLRLAGKSQLPEAVLSDEQVDQLLAFLETLTDPCLKDRDCMAKWIPDNTVADPDGLRLQAQSTL